MPRARDLAALQRWPHGVRGTRLRHTLGFRPCFVRWPQNSPGDALTLTPISGICIGTMRHMLDARELHLGRVSVAVGMTLTPWSEVTGNPPDTMEAVPRLAMCTARDTPVALKPTILRPCGVWQGLMLCLSGIRRSEFCTTGQQVPVACPQVQNRLGVCQRSLTTSANLAGAKMLSPIPLLPN